MDKLFDLNNPVMQFLDRAGKLMILNILFLVCSLPIITLGAALTAMHRVTQEMAMDEDPSIAKHFFFAFRNNFKKATLVWIVVLAFAGAIGFSFLVTVAWLGGGTAQVCRNLLLVTSIIVLAVTSYIFPLMAHYENDVKTYLLNAAVLTIGRLPRTVLLTACNAVPFAMLLCPVAIVVKTVILWVLIGFALISYLVSLLLKPVFREYEV